ncbi:GntR family transcriptional regulator [Leifsonia aquatica]|uniref:GntR family transcriptional regulator n=1 Tax=Leifsonia aquatica TaxID=144185 RepID=UPI000469EF3B|nr:GntR family transcriptional regulator [Leifsonia aquatica]
MPIPSEHALPRSRVLLRDMVYSRIVDAILGGQLKPGEILHDQDIEKWLQVSRTPIREALGELAWQGLVEMEPNRFTRVAVPLPSEVADTMRTLGAMLAAAVHLAVPQLTPEMQKTANEAGERLRSALQDRDLEGTLSSAFALWQHYIDNCGNAVLQRIYNGASAGLAFRLRAAQEIDRQDAAFLLAHLEQLLDSTNTGDGWAAKRAVETFHLLGEPATAVMHQA